MWYVCPDNDCAVAFEKEENEPADCEYLACWNQEWWKRRRTE